MSSKVRGRPFKAGNAGRPPGAKNKSTQLLENLVEGQTEELQTLLKLAKSGDVSMSADGAGSHMARAQGGSQ